MNPARRSTMMVAVLALASAGCEPDALFELTSPLPTVRLDIDESPHEFGGGEWWYYTGRVTDEDGRGYGIEAVIFHVPRLPFLANVGQVWTAHYAVLDETSGKFVYDQSVSLDKPIGDAVPVDGFDLTTPLVQLSGFGGHDRIRAAMPDGSLTLDLELLDERGAILHGDDGYVPFGTTGRAFYYSRPTMRSVGTLTVDGTTHQVTGEFWFDRQWGMQVTNPWALWDWFSLRLDDGTRIMLFVFRDPVAPVWFGTYIPPTGDPWTLGADNIAVTPTASWTSPHTDRTYPVAWRIDIPSQELKLTVTAIADDQELDVRDSTFNVYWEGLCDIDGTRAGQPIAGHAYIELTNYP